MKELTPEGKQKIKDIASNYKLDTNVVMTMLEAVANGGGNMAQFNIPQLGGNGQWMKGGMTMVGDMFNYSLQGTVSSLCSELSNLLASANIFKEEPANQTGRSSGSWWPAEFGSPSSIGAQNHWKYAYFPPPVSRLILEIDGKQTIYDTLNYHISGVSQQQGTGNSYLFTSNIGPVDVHKLPIISSPAATKAEPPTPVEPVKHANVTPSQQTASSGTQEDIFTTIEKLAGLLQKQYITEEEFAQKKAELLKRL